MDPRTVTAVHFLELLGAVRVGVPLARWGWCPRCRAVAAHRLGALTAAGERVYTCNTCHLPHTLPLEPE